MSDYVDFDAAVNELRLAQGATDVAVVKSWMPPAIDRAERASVLDGPDGFAAFERKYGCRVTADVARLWGDPHLHRRTSQGSDAWLGLRKQFITGSRVGDILDLNLYPGNNRRRVFLDYTDTDPEPFVGNIYTEHGKLYENCAIASFERVMATEGGSACVTLPFDFLISSHVPHYAYSPDGVLGTGDLVEAKCPSVRKIIPGYVLPHYGTGQVSSGRGAS